MKKVKESYPFGIDEYLNVYNVVTGNKLNGSVYSTGYRVFDARVSGVKYRESHHRLVALAFIPNPENKPHVNHIDGDKLNNNLSNLEWVTPKENIHHALENKLMVVQGEDCGKSIYSEAQIKEVCTLLEQGMRPIDIPKLLDVSYDVVNSVYHRKTWTSISSDYKFKHKKRKRYSEEKIRWVCVQINLGLSNSEIAGKCDMPVHTVCDIRGKRSFKKISDNYF